MLLGKDLKSAGENAYAAQTCSVGLWPARFSPDRDHNLVFRRTLRPRVMKGPAQPKIAVVELRDIGNQALEPHAHELPAALPQLEHHRDRRSLPRRLI